VFRDTSSNFSSAVYDPRETAANKFAAALLMPAFAVKALVKDGHTDLEDLAEMFVVSSVAMKYRLKNLGFLA
jgi:Zn-dependent peptidase ImmA (M78 family)